MNEPVVMLTITRIEARHLADLTLQFVDLLQATSVATDDPGLARLVPDAYPDDAQAAADFRHATERELLDRRCDDAQRVLTDLATGGTGPGGDTDVVDLALSMEGARAWMRTLAALRLVIASRVGITDEDAHDVDDPRFGVYDWLGYRLEGLVQSVDAN
ncbi:MAG: DUF2017 family protein [Microbacterium sp.]|uniref:DUF2017 family protein n=1 Tax=Microbacterium sp. TaxID=51671 RepID=UPI003A8AA7C6